MIKTARTISNTISSKIKKSWHASAPCHPLLKPFSNENHYPRPPLRKRSLTYVHYVPSTTIFVLCFIMSALQRLIRVIGDFSDNKTYISITKTSKEKQRNARLLTVSWYVHRKISTNKICKLRLFLYLLQLPFYSFVFHIRTRMHNNSHAM